MTQIGLLVPRSAIYSTINFDLVDGLKCSLGNMGISDITIKTAGIGVGGNDKEIYTACEQLLFDGAEIIVGYINPVTAVMIQPLVVNAGALLVIVSAGYHIPSGDFKPVNTYTVSLQGTLGCRVLPAIAAAMGDTSIAFTCSFYDAGYRAPMAVYNGIVDAGSSILFNHATQLKKKDFTIVPLTQFLAANPGTAVIAACCGDMTADLFEAIKTEPEYRKHNMYGTPFVAEEVWLAKIPYPGIDVTAVVPWATCLETEVNAIFIETLKKKNRTANVFSLLSWEAGMLIAKALEADSITDRIALLEGYTYTGPRGTVTIDKETHETNAPLYKTTIVVNDANGMCKLDSATEVAAGMVGDNRSKLAQEIAAFDGTGTSWYNAYGCLD